jgi:integrase
MPSFRRDDLRKTWTVVWDEPRDPLTGKRNQKTRRGFKTQGAAKTWFRAYEQDQRSGENIAAAEMTVDQSLTAYIAGADVEPSTLHAYRKRHRLWISPYIGMHKLKVLNTAHIEAWHIALKERGLAVASIRDANALLSSMLRLAVDRGDLSRNVTRLARTLPRKRKVNRTVWDESEIKTFLKVADQDSYGLIFRLMLFSQVRPGEALALKWSGVDWHNGTIRIEQGRSTDDSGRFIIGQRAKREASHRVIPLTADLMERLRRHQGAQNRVIGIMGQLRQDHGLVFARDDGRMIANSTMQGRLETLIVEAGVPRITPHGQRHSGASLLMARGEHIKVVSERLGHKSIVTTADLYSHLSPGMQRDVSERLGAVFDVDETALDDRLLDNDWEERRSDS